jgi:hypothetical protein
MGLDDQSLRCVGPAVADEEHMSAAPHLGFEANDHAARLAERRARSFGTPPRQDVERRRGHEKAKRNDSEE